MSLLTATGVVFSGCQPDNPQPNNNQTNGSVAIKWNATINGQSYAWQGSYPESSTNQTGGSQFSIQSSNIGQLTLNDASNGKTITIGKIGMTLNGSYTLSQTNYSSDNTIMILDGANSLNMLSNGYGGSITVNITTFPSNSVSANGVSNNTLVKGNFSGNLGNSSGTLVPVSGSFESVRIN